MLYVEMKNYKKGVQNEKKIDTANAYFHGLLLR